MYLNPAQAAVLYAKVKDTCNENNACVYLSGHKYKNIGHAQSIV